MKPRFFVIASLAFAGMALLRASEPPTPVAAIAYIVCGQPLGFLIVNSDGSTERHSFDDKPALAVADKIPDDHRTVLKILGDICVNNDKTT